MSSNQDAPIKTFVETASLLAIMEEDTEALNTLLGGMTLRELGVFYSYLSLLSINVRNHYAIQYNQGDKNEQPKQQPQS